MNKWDKKLNSIIAARLKMLERIYAAAAAEAARIGLSIDNVNPDKPFRFDDYPKTQSRVEKLMESLFRSVNAVAVNSIKSAWNAANGKDDEFCRGVLGERLKGLSEGQMRMYFNNHDTARDAFLQRREQGLKLSDRVWRYTKQFKSEIEMGLDAGIGEGKSAAELARDLKQYLNEPEKLFRRVRDKRGNLQLSKNAAAYHPGAGVYRSSYKNSLRLTRTETNMAYRSADYARTQDFDFVVGIEIHTSGNHPVPDICDTLAGKYPKDFKFTGWHPQCRCYVTTILKTQEEMDKDFDDILEDKDLAGGSVNSVDDVPEEFTEWVENNRERAKGWSSMPYFVRQNPQYIKDFEVDTYTKAERKFTRARNTGEAMNESLGLFLNKKYPELHNTEKAAIFHYTKGDGAAYRQLNRQLRNGNLSEFNEAFSALLSQGLSKLETTTKTTYRSVRLNKTKLQEYVNLAKNSGEYTFKGFTSASLERSSAVKFGTVHAGRKNNESDVLFIIQGKSGHPIEDLSQFGGRFTGKPNQREVLFDKGLKIRFDKVEKEGDHYVFYLTEI